MSWVVVITGPTAAGKSDVALYLAERSKAEIVSADSMLVYKEPAIITSKPESAVLKRIKHHFVGIVSVTESYDVFRYFRAAKERIISLVRAGTPVIVCGGSGLYVRALLEGVFESPGQDLPLRQVLKEKAVRYGTGHLFKELEAVDPATAKKISANDLKRIIRALEVYYLSGEPLSAKKKTCRGLYGEVALKVFGLRFPREELYARINRRVEAMFRQGAVEEVKQLLKLNLSFTAEKIIGIQEIREFLEGKTSEEQTCEKMKQNTRNFAKRQFTWFNRERGIEWVDMAGKSIEEVSREITAKQKICTKL